VVGRWWLIEMKYPRDRVFGPEKRMINEGPNRIGERFNGRGGRWRNVFSYSVHRSTE
jgi:hypothetical protein